MRLSVLCFLLFYQESFFNYPDLFSLSLEAFVAVSSVLCEEVSNEASQSASLLSMLASGRADEGRFQGN